MSKTGIRLEVVSDGFLGGNSNSKCCEFVRDSCPSKHRSRWWFQIFFIFTPSCGRFPFWLIFFRWVETTNQCYVLLFACSLGVCLVWRWRHANCLVWGISVAPSWASLGSHGCIVFVTPLRGMTIFVVQFQNEWSSSWWRFMLSSNLPLKVGVYLWINQVPIYFSRNIQVFQNLGSLDQLQHVAFHHFQTLAARCSPVVQGHFHLKVELEKSVNVQGTCHVMKKSALKHGGF